MIKSTIILVVAILLCTFGYFMAPKEKGSRSIASVKTTPLKKTIFLGVDGLSRENFEYARNQLGYFKIFQQVSSHIAPFPSISDYSWNILTHSRDVFGPRGAIGTYEGTFYDHRKNRLADDPREYFRRIGSTEHYFNGFFEHYLNPYIESLLYFPTEELPKLELKQIKEAIIESGDKPLVTAMVASVDALAHTREDSMEFLKDLDAFLTEIKNHYDQKGVAVEIILVSDHGQASRTKPGEKVLPLLAIDLKPVLEKAGLEEKKRLTEETDVVIPVMALGNYVTVSFKNLEKRKDFVDALRGETWFEQAFFIERAQDYVPGVLTVIVSDRSGDARVQVFDYPKNPTYEYTPLTGNPLELPDEALGKKLSDQDAWDLSLKTRFPDSLFRLAQMAHQDEAVMPDLIFTTSDSYRVSGQFDSVTSMFLTHGSLSRRSSLGILASTNPERKLPQYVRTKDILAESGIEAKSIAKTARTGLNSDPRETYKIVSAAGYKGIETGAGSFSNERIFGIINNAVHYSQYVFDLPTIDQVASVFRPVVEKFSKVSESKESVGELNFDMKQVDTLKTLGPKDFGLITDLILKHGDMDKIQKDPRFIQLQKRISTGSTTSIDVNDLAKKAAPYTAAAKRITMKGYSSTFLLEKALTLPEFPYMEDKRDLKVWNDWETKRDSIIGKPAAMSTDSKLVKSVFQEIFKEQTYAEDITPVALPLLYNRLHKIPKNLTIVYVPGIYNSIFDNEIFQIGLDAIKYKLGVRVIEAPVLSACSSNFNSHLILESLKQDIEYRTERNLPPQKYFFIGYSKGGMDSLHALAKADPKFVEDYVSGLLTIASPLAGSSILNRTDLPITLLELLASENIPDVCRDSEKAASSITPAAAQLFFKNQAKDLIGLTRYYSLSFRSNIKDAHLFMKATKDIAGFTEENDGVVTVSSSKFPESFNALDLGTVDADHLAGIVASKFPQQAFMQSVILSLLEVDAFNDSLNRSYNEQIRYNSPLYDGDYHEGFMSKLLGADKRLEEKLKKAKAISDTEKKVIAKKIEEDIKTAVKDTPYEVKDFAIDVDNKGKVKIVFAKASEDYRYYLFWKTKEVVEVEDAKGLVKVLISRLQRSGKNLLKGNVELWRTYPISDRTPFPLPANELAFNPDFRINLRELDKFIKGKSVTPILPSQYAEGVKIIYDHRRMVDFRTEYQFNYESTAPLAADDSENSGWQTVLDENKKIWARLASANSSIRLTSYALRFKVSDFPRISFNLKVTKGVPGANVLFGGSGKDDSAFQIWFSIRELKQDTDRKKLDPAEKMRLFGYYFGDQVSGTQIKVDDVYENYYSKKNFIVTVLPEAKQIPIGVSPDDLRKPIITTKEFLSDVRRSFPDVDPEKLEIVGITIQHDSNDTKSSSEAYFREISFHK